MAYRQRSKYHSKKVTVNGITFDSKKEAMRYDVLSLLEQQGQISDLRRQVKFLLIPAQREPATVGARGGKKRGKLIEREVAYYADFVYRDKNGDLVVEDVKGIKTDVYVLKRKLVLYKFGIRIKEV